MKTEFIKALHPDPDKNNKSVSLEKYNAIKDGILSALENTELTHTELMDQLCERLKNSFEGSIKWYGETVKLDLEARKIIERTATKPQKYLLTTRPNYENG